MESLLASRKISEEPSKLQNLSPQKYGKAAFSALTYTPSKLADNVLYKEFSNQKKLEQGSSKLRQTQASNSILQDRLAQLQQQKEGIERTLSDQISMYKKILKEKQEKNERRIKTMQESFNAEIGKIIAEKQQQAKYAQAEKELLQSRIAELQQIVANLQYKLSNVSGDHQSMVNENQKLKLIQESLTKRLQDAQNAFKKYEQKCKQQIQGLKTKLQQTQMQWQRRLQKQLQTKDRQIQNLDRLHRNQLQKIQSKRVQQALLKNQQLKDLAATFQKQTSRLNGIIAKKEQQIDILNRNIQAERQKSFSMAKGYQNQITNLSHQKSRLKQQLLKASLDIQKLNIENRETQQRLNTENSILKDEINQIRKDLQLNQINLMRQIDKNEFSVEELTRQIARLRVENDQVAPLMDQNARLNRQLRNMKQLLIESSLQMERCKEEFIRIGKQKDLLSLRLRQLGIENQTLYRIKNQREQEARNWRQSYFTQKGKY